MVAVPSKEVMMELRFEKKMTREDIAEHFGVSYATVRRWIKVLDIPRPKKEDKPKRLEQIMEPRTAKPDDGYNELERARINLQGRVVERSRFGYYLDGYPASVDRVLTESKSDEPIK